MDRWETLEDASKSRVVGSSSRCKDTVEQRKSLAIEDEGIEVQSLANCFDVIKLRVFDVFWQEVLGQ